MACLCSIYNNFNPRTREGCDGTYRKTGVGTIISIHAPAKGATLVRDVQDLASKISIHAPAKGATLTTCLSAGPQLNFNPRTREGCDQSHIEQLKDQVRISIHAPAKGATLFYLHTGQTCRISIHAPAKGATLALGPLYMFRQISIHAPAKGATDKKTIYIGSSKFQSTHPRRVRPSFFINFSYTKAFQSTHPRRVRR